MHQRLNIAACLLLASTALGCGKSGSDGPSTVSLDAVTVPAGESGDIVVTVHRSGSGDRAISVPFTTHDDSATAATDYVAATGMVEWADGDMEDKQITVSLVDDLVIEPSENMKIELGEPTNDATLGTAAVTATITDDDHPGDSFAVTSAGRLVHFDRVEPGRLSWSVELSGLGSEKILGIDVRPADGLLYALTDAKKLYTIDPMTGAATAKATLIADPADATSPFTALTGNAFGIDFNPLIDRLRVTSNTGQNLQINVDSGEVTTDTAISGLSSGYSAIAHSNNVAPACRTSLYAIDVSSNRFLSQSLPVGGVANGIGGLGMDATATGGFDVVTDATGVSAGYAVLTVNGDSGMYSIDLSSGAATVVRAVVGPLNPGETVTTFALPTVPASSAVTQKPGELYGVTATNVVSFNRDAPAKLCSSVAIGGLAANENILDLDMRPYSGVLYVLTNIGTAGKLHRLDPTTGMVSPPIPVTVPLQGTEFGLDFDPTGTNTARIVSNSGQNIRVTDLTTGAATADSALNGAGTSANGAAYTDSVPGAGNATLYVVDAATDRLRIQSPANSGTLVDVGPLGVDVADAKFDIDGRDNASIVVVTVGSQSELHTIDLTTGALSPSLGTIAGSALRGVTRATPNTNVYGITTDNKLVRISLTDPSQVTVISDPMLMPPVSTITGLQGNEHLVGIDFRPGSNVMYAIGNMGGLYTLNSSTAAANRITSLAADPMDTSSPFTSLSGTSFDLDFDPTGTVPLRIVSDNEQNIRIPNVGANAPKVFTDSPIQPVSGPVDVTAAAYTNSFVPPAGVTPSSTLYVIDVASAQLMTMSPTTGTLNACGPMGGTFHDPAVPMLSGFDIAGGNNGIALAAFQRPSATPGVPEPFSRLYRINLATGAATEIGNGIGGAPLRSLAVQIR